MNDMKKSAAVSVSLLAAMAATLMGGCGSNPRQVRRCVDEKGNVLPDSDCERGYYYGGMGRGYPGWVYGGSGGNNPGNRAMGFTRTPNPDADVVAPNGRVISRGGLGRSGGSGGGFFGGFG
jgi:hypothetical protein